MKDLLVCKKVTKKLDGFSIRNIDFAAPKGCIVGVIGRNGAGKTTLLRTIMGLYRLCDEKAGDIFIDDISVKENIKKYKGSIAYVLNSVPFEMTIRIVEIKEIYGRYYNRFNYEKFDELIEKYNLPYRKRVSELSKGEQIKLQLAFAISQDAKLYIMDEPTGNLDVQFRDEFYKTVREIVNDGERTVIYASHLIEELEEFADYILWLKRDGDESAVKYYGTIDDLRDNYRMIEGTDELSSIDKDKIIGGRKRESHSETLVKLSERELPLELRKNARYADVKEIMYYEEKSCMGSGCKEG